LANEGERLRLVDTAGITALDFAYNDAWQPVSDGRGAALEPINPKGDLNNRSNWRSSSTWAGTPGASPADRLEIREIVVAGDLVQLGFVARAGIGYVVEARPSLEADGWEIAERLAPQTRDTPLTFALPRPPGAHSMFYRLTAP
jgi:hypothetical protein